MGKIIIKDRNDEIHSIQAKPGMTIMEIIRDAGLDIEAACGGCCACATCHVYVDPNWQEKTGEIGEDEESMLDQAFNVTKSSRLSCQIEYTDELNEIFLTLAPE